MRMAESGHDDLRRAALGVVCAGFSQEAGRLEEVPDETAEMIREGLAGAILFRRNIETPLQTARLVSRLKGLAGGRPFLLAVDQEGGRVARLRGEPYAEIPAMRQIGESGSEETAYRAGQELAHSVRLVGFDVDFAPVMDVDTNPDNPVIGDRSFGRDPELVSRLGVALARGLEDAGVASCAKHFPGHGDTSQDSHLTLPRLEHGMERMERVELVPFRAYAAAHLASAMSAHVVFEAMDPSHPGLPATFSRAIQTDLLRGRLGFEGLAICDDLEMKAVSGRWSIPEAAVMAVRAGIDLLLICHTAGLQREAAEHLAEEAERDADFRARLLDARRRVEAFQKRWARPFGEEEISRLRAILDNSAGESGGQRLMAQASDPTESWRAPKRG